MMIYLHVGEVAEELEHGEGGRRRHVGRGQQVATRARCELRLHPGLAGAGGGEEGAEVGEPGVGARVERHRREEPRGRGRRERRRREDPRPRRRAEHRREAVEVEQQGAVVVGDVVGRRQRADGPLDGGQPRGRGQRGGGRGQELRRLLRSGRARLHRRVELSPGGGWAREPLHERHEVPGFGVDDLGRGVVDDDRRPRLVLLLLVVTLLQVVALLRRDGRLLDLVGVLADGEPRRARALQLPAPRRRRPVRRVHLRVPGGRRRAGISQGFVVVAAVRRGGEERGRGRRVGTVQREAEAAWCSVEEGK
jgi:hypothetical protein